MIQVPDDLAELDRWAVWRNEAGRKIPYRVDGRGASTTKSEDWGQLDDALKALATGRYTGLAFVFIQSDGLVGVDLDDALDSTGKPKAAIQGMLEKFHDTYAETSPSGCGVKLWTRGKLVGSVKAALADGVGLEIYATARYFAFTGMRFRGAPLEVADHATDIELLYQRFRPQPGLKAIPGGKIAHGTQHNRLVAIAGALRRHGVGDVAVDACLQIVNREQCELPGKPESISRITRSTARWLQ
jgi:primase-polymerase (primpol)-like protein